MVNGTEQDYWPDDDDLVEWAHWSAEAGDNATHLIALIALGEPPANIVGASAQQIASEWRVTLSEAKEVRGLLGNPRAARERVAAWGSPWPDEED